jgi:SAM-dependent methyltransferase
VNDASSGRGRFAGGDQAYLRDVQYRDSSNLAARANLHVKYGRADWFPWLASQIDWQAGGEVLEVGCGAGWLWGEAAAVLPSGLVLTLTDLSPGMVDEAVARARDTGRYAAVEGKVTDAQRLPFADGSFDVTVSNHMLYHLPEPALGVAELARVVRAEGVSLVATNGRGHLQEIRDLRRELFPDDDTPEETIDAFGIETGEPLLREHYAEVELRRHPDVLRCTDPEDVLAFAMSTPPAEDASPDQARALRAAIDRRFEAGGGVMEINKNVGLFICRAPRPASG